MAGKQRRPKHSRHKQALCHEQALPTSTARLAQDPAFCCSLWEIALPITVLLWTFLLGCTPMWTTDIWWHLRTGQLMLERGVIPHTDWFTFTDWDQPWIDLHWGFQLLVTGLYSAGGVNLLVLAKAFCLTVTVAIGWLASGREMPISAKAVCWIPAVICLSGRAVVRPEMLSLIFLATWLCILSRVEQKPRLIWCLPLLQLVWTNCHALFVLGLVVGAAYMIDLLARHLARGRWGLEPAGDAPSAICLIRAGWLVLLACLVNPYFEEGALFPLVLYRKFSVDQTLYSTIAEFRRPIEFIWDPQTGFRNLDNIYFVSQAGLWLATVLSFAWLARERRISVMRMLLVVAFTHLAWKATRNTSLFTVVSVFVLCGNCGDALRLGRLTKLTKQPPKRQTGRKPATTPTIAPAHAWLTRVTGLVVVGLILSVFTGHWTLWSGEGRRFAFGEREGWYAHDAARFAGQPGFPDRAFVANIGQAAVYVFHNSPDRRVFIDGRLEVAIPQTFELFGRIRSAMVRGDPRWQSMLRDQNGNLPAVMLDSRYSRSEINGMLITPGWRLVFADAAAAVFIQTELADRLNLRPADPGSLFFPSG